MKILYVEDNPADVEFVQRALDPDDAGVTLTVVGTLAQARLLLGLGGPGAGGTVAPHAPPFDLVLTDLGLPDGNGLDLVRDIRSQALPVALVTLTGQGDQDLAVAALKAGANDYLPKTAGFDARLLRTLRAARQRFLQQQTRQRRGLRVLYAEHYAVDIDLTRRHCAQHAPHITLEVVADPAGVLARLPNSAALAVTAAVDGADAGASPGASASQGPEVDVLLLDLHLNGDNGLDVLQAVRAERGLDIPVVIVTGQGSEHIATEAIRLGATDYLVKHANYLHGLPLALENAFHRVSAEREYAALHRSERALQALNAGLEARVQQRTAELELARDRAQQASRAKTGFLSSMSHELRTPMNAVLGFAQLLETDANPALTPRQRSYAQNILRAGGHLMALINELLDMASIEAGKLSISLGPVDLPALIQGCLHLVEVAATEQAVSVLPLRLDAGPWQVQADPMRLTQIVLNLLDNAVKYNRPGGTVALALADDGPAVRLSISDTGPGLSAEQQTLLFQTFERVGAENSGIPGSGIGLALSKRIATLMGADIGLHSVVGRGSTFWLRLPRVAA